MPQNQEYMSEYEKNLHHKMRKYQQLSEDEFRYNQVQKPAYSIRVNEQNRGMQPL